MTTLIEESMANNPQISKEFQVSLPNSKWSSEFTKIPNPSFLANRHFFLFKLVINIKQSDKQLVTQYAQHYFI